MHKAIPLLVSGSMSAMVFLSGCAVSPSKPVSGAATGAAVGAIGGAVVGNNTGSGNSASGAAIGGAAGAIVGGVIGMVQEAKERTEQDRLAQERAYQQELAKRRAQEAKFRAAIEEELAVAEGFRISQQEIANVEGQAKDLETRLKELQEERNTALARKRALDTATGRISAAEQEIQRLEAELADLRGDRAAGISGGPFVEHRVERGETLQAIAVRYKVTVSEIRALNTIPSSDALVPGQVLRVPNTSVASGSGAL